VPGTAWGNQAIGAMTRSNPWVWAVITVVVVMLATR
jgi:hypothetical protein